MEHLLEATPIALCILDSEKRIVMANKAMASILVPDTAQMVGESIVDFIPAAGPLLDDYLGLAARGRALPARQFAWRGRHYHVSFGMMQDHEATPCEFYVAAVDVTRRAKIERQLRDARRRLIATTRSDHLTGLLNRRGLETVLHRELRRARQGDTPLSLAIVDIDWFKPYNDTLGHPQGDKCLRVVAGAIRACLRRPGDAGSRYGGEEFVLVLPNTDAREAMIVAQRCRSAINDLDILHPGSPHRRLTVSIGVSCVMPDAMDGAVGSEAATLLAAADRALYRAKDKGRDRVESADDC